MGGEEAGCEGCQFIKSTYLMEYSSMNGVCAYRLRTG